MEQAKKRLTVGAGGIDPRDVRLIEIVFRHSQYNPIEFELQTRLELKTAEVLLINPMTQDGLKALAKLRTSGLNIPVISVVPRGASPGSKYAIALDRLTLQLLPMLNKVVEDHYGHESGNTVAAKLVKAPISSDFANEHLRRSAAETATQPLANQSSFSQNSQSYFTNQPHSAGHGHVAPQPERLAPAPQVQAPENYAQAAPQTTLQAASYDVPGLKEDVEHNAQEIRVLVVDDSPTVRSQLAGAVRKLGMACDPVGSAMEGLKLCEQKHFDLALVDVVMPEMDGYKLTKEIRKHFKQTPVIILTSKSSPFDLARGALAGCDTYLVKPVTMQKLKDAMFKSLRKSMAIDDVEAVLQAQLARNAQASAQMSAQTNAQLNIQAGAPTSGQAAPQHRPQGAQMQAQSNNNTNTNIRALPTRDVAKTA
jgi:CheY-like chemotaxis protein